MLLLSLAGCFFSLPEKAACTEPHLWYAPDGTGDTYFGCTPPEGWRETPPDDEAYAAVTTTSPAPAEDGEDPPDIDTGPATVTFPPEDTAPPDPVPTGDTGEPPIDTASEPPEDTGAPPADTSDTGLLPEGDTSDTGLLDTGLPEDTGAIPGEELPPDTALPVDTGLVPVEDDDTATP